MLRRLLAIGFFLITCAVPPSAYAADSPAAVAALTEADRLLKDGEFEQAYQLLAPHEADLAGDYRYDYMLGVAALDSGRAVEATFALERVVAVRPNFAGARMDLARAYVAVGDYARARAGFEEVLRLNPPPLVRQVAENHLAAIARHEEAGRPTRLSGHLEFGLGHDTNVNSSPDQSSVYIPVFGLDLNLDAANQETDDNYGRVGAGMAFTHRLDPGVALYGGVDTNLRRQSEADEFDQDTLDGKLGLSLGQGADTVRIGLHRGRFWLGESVNRDTLGADISWHHIYSAKTAVTLFAQYNQLRHKAELEANDVDVTVAGINALRSFDATSAVFASLYGGVEQEVNRRADGDKSLYGVSLGGQKALTAGAAVYGSVGYQWGDYQTENVAFRRTRRDELAIARAGLSWSVSKDWSVRGELVHYANDSNVEINEYSRTDTSITLRRDFR